LNVHCYSWQCNFRLAAVTADFFGTVAAGKIFS